MKVVVEDTMFIPNYEDYDKVGTNTGAAVYPQLWPEEMAGEGAIYRKAIEDRERWGNSLPSIEDIIERGKRTAPSKDDAHSYKAWVTGVLTKLAHENGWKVLCEIVDRFGDIINVIYHIPSTPDAVTLPIKRKEPPPPPDDGIKLDMKALANHMGDMMPPSFRLKHDKRDWQTPTDRKELQDLVCSMLAKDNGWELVEPHRINKTFYRIV